jgi:phosphoribosylformylglycinamidine cyclo-ligase
VDRSRVIDGSRIVAGDVVFGLPSVGLHTNGYSLARKLLFDVAGHRVDTHVDELGCTVGEELLKPHKSYLPALSRLISHEGVVKGLAHITGGGLVENIPRILPRNVDVALKEESWPSLPVYELMQKIGNVPREEMLRTFNLGLGMIVVTSPQYAEMVRERFMQAGETFYEVGEVVEGNGKVVFV